MLYREVIAISCESHAEHKYTVGKLKSVNGRPGGTCTNH